jgi:hypothetical protein
MDHPTLDQLIRWRRGEVAEEEVLAIGRHLAACSECTMRSAERLALDEPANVMIDEIEKESEPRRVWPWLVAASVAIALLSPIVWRTQSHVVPPAPAPRATPIAIATGDAWTSLVDGVRRGATIGEPDALRSIRVEADVLRGTAASKLTFDPSGVVVKSSRPSFAWPAPNGATSQVQVFRDDTEVARSGVLTGSRWRAERNLERGVAYSWTVRVEHDGASEILPASPSPVARFRIVDAATLADLESAERHHPNDHLLLGILDARAGLVADAMEQLRLVTDPRDAEVARRVMRDVESWTR